MSQLVLNIEYQKNTGLALNSIELRNLYFTGIELKDQFGIPIPEETINFYIESAQKEIADALQVKLKRTCYREDRHYVYDDWIQWGYIPTTYPVVKPMALKGFLNSNLQIDYPQDWLSYKKQAPDVDLYHRSISLVPATGSGASFTSQPYYLNTPYSNIYGSKLIPNYWTLDYITGFDRIPVDIMKAIGMKASIDLFRNISDIITGTPGVVTKSIGIDGLSQSQSGAGGSGKLAFAGRIDSYQKELDERLMPRLKDRYVGFTFGTM
jgi:hypothetical protein